MAEKIRGITTAINSLRDIDGGCFIVSLSTSFPRSVIDFGGKSGVIGILERDFHADLGGKDVCAYGDHVSIHVEPYEAFTRGFIPRIDYPTAGAWHYVRRRGTQGNGYRKAAEIVVNEDYFDDNLDIRGARDIRDAARGNIDGRGNPAFWIGVRVNIHMHRQIHYAEDAPSGDEWDDYEDF